MTKDYYKMLGVPQNATKDEIKKAYRKLAHQYHPDKGGDEKQFKEINEAYQILSDEKKRSQYDQFGQEFEGAAGGGGGQGGFEWPGGFGFGNSAGGERPQDFDFSEIFEDFLGMGFGSGARTRSKERRGKDIQADLSTSFEESVFGGKKEIDLSKLSRCLRCDGAGGEPGSEIKTCATCQGRGNVQKTQRTFLGAFTQVSTCPECNGSGKRPEKLCSQCKGRGVEQRIEHLEVFIPKGVRDGEILKITGKGEASPFGGIPGDLYLRLHVTEHKIFRRQGDDIVMLLLIKLTQAVLGDTIDIATLDGTINLKIPEGIQSGDVLKVRGKGAYSSNGYGRGNLLIETKVDIPRKVNRTVKKVFEDLQSEGL